MTKKAKTWKHPVADYKYRSGNEGRHHRGLVHQGYASRLERSYNYRKPPDDGPEKRAA